LPLAWLWYMFCGIVKVYVFSSYQKNWRRFDCTRVTLILAHSSCIYDSRWWINFYSIQNCFLLGTMFSAKMQLHFWLYCVKRLVKRRCTCSSMQRGLRRQSCRLSLPCLYFELLVDELFSLCSLVNSNATCFCPATPLGCVWFDGWGGTKRDGTESFYFYGVWALRNLR
jgi:hypothetical protein